MRSTHSFFRKSEGKKCRILLDEIQQLTFVVQDKEALVGLNKELSRLLNDMQQHKPLEDGLVVEGGESKKCEEVSSKARPIEKRCKASLPKRKTKSKYSGRVGEKAAMYRKTCFVHVPVLSATRSRTASHKRTNPASEVAPKLKVINGIKEEKNREDVVGAACASANQPTAENPKTEAVHSVNEGTQHQNREDVVGAAFALAETQQNEALHLVRKDVLGVVEAACASANQPTAAKQNSEAVHSKETLTSAKKDPPSLTPKISQEGNGMKNTGPQGELPTPQITVISDETLGPTIWLTLRHVDPDDPKSKLTLLQEHKSNILDKKGWLFDTEIQAGQILLKKQFPLIDGLHDPSVKGHLVEPASTEFVQIVNVGEHWLCLTSIGVPCPGAVRVFDSLYRKPNATAAEHACHILLHTGDQVMFINEKVQRQMGSSDCGLYALAFATDLCHGIDPTSPRSYDQALMRQHYVECPEKGRMAPFPSSTRRVIYHNDQKRTLVQIFCGCRLPNDKKEYVQCFKCSGWYHLDCERVPDWAVNSKRKWQCQKCKNRKPLSLCNN